MVSDPNRVEVQCGLGRLAPFFGRPTENDVQPRVTRSAPPTGGTSGANTSSASPTERLGLTIRVRAVAASASVMGVTPPQSPATKTGTIRRLTLDVAAANSWHDRRHTKSDRAEQSPSGLPVSEKGTSSKALVLITTAGVMVGAYVGLCASPPRSAGERQGEAIPEHTGDKPNEVVETC